MPRCKCSNLNHIARLLFNFLGSDGLAPALRLQGVPGVEWLSGTWAVGDGQSSLEGNGTVGVGGRSNVYFQVPTEALT